MFGWFAQPPHSLWGLSSLTRDRTSAFGSENTVKTQCPNHWITREFPAACFLIQSQNCSVIILFSLSVVSSSSATQWTVAGQAPLFMGFPRQEYWSALPFPSPGDLLTQGSDPHFLHWQVNSFTTELPGKLCSVNHHSLILEHFHHPSKKSLTR